MVHRAVAVLIETSFGAAAEELVDSLIQRALDARPTPGAAHAALAASMQA